MGKYLTCHDAGWSVFEIESFKGTGSYLTDVPLDFLYSFIDYYLHATTPAIRFDEEGSEFTIVVSDFNLFIIDEKNEIRLYNFEIVRDDFIKQILQDIIKERLKWKTFLGDNRKYIELGKRIEDLNFLISHSANKNHAL